MSERKVYTGKPGKTYTALDPPLGQGGEGAVFKIQEDPSKVIKVFWEENRTPEREKKLVAMTDMHLPDNLTTQNTWPVDLVYENDTFAGFVMKAVTDSIPVNRLYMDDYKKRCTYDKRVFIAKNICAAVHSVHIAGQVVGDLNPKNVCVNPDTGMVTLVDTNSYHITDPKTGEVHRCEVGLPEYLAKEIQLTLRKGTTLKDAPLPTFTKETDNFALAVHIFALLMNGCHPYACARDMGADIDSLSKNKSSVTMPQPIDNICTGNFTFDNPAKGTKPPLYAPYYGMLPDNIRQLFKRAFVTGSDDPKARPDAVEWFKALDGLLHSLKKCKTDATHIFPANAGSCPWCQLNSGKQPPPPPPPPPELSDGGNGNNEVTQKDPPLTYDELKVLGDSIEANAGGKKIIKTVSRVGNCVILELKKKKNNLTAFVDKSISSITEDGNKIRYFFYDEGNAEGIELYINNNINKPGNSGSGGGKRNKVKNQTGNKSKKWIIIPIVIAAAVAATLIILFAIKVLPPNENTINKENTTNTESTINNKIIGEWESQDFDGTFVYTFKDDGSGNYDDQGLQMPFTFTTNGDKISILYNGDTNPFDYVYKIDDDVLMLKDSLGLGVLYNRKGKKTKIEKNTDSDVTLLSLAENITEQFGEISYVYNIDAKIHYTIEGDDIVNFEITEGEVIPYMLNFITESHEKKHIGGKANGQETILYDYEEYYINDNFGENILYTKFYSDTSDNGWTKAEGVMKTDYFFLQSIFYNIYEKNTEATLTEITEKVNGKETYKIELSFPGEELKEELEKIFMLNEYLDNDFTKVEVKTEIFIYKENNLPARIYMDFGENGKKIIENELRNIASDYADDVVVKCDKFYIDMVIDDYGKAEKIEVPSEVLNAAKINSDI